MQPPKCFVSFAKPPAHPIVSKPISSHPFNHQLDLLLPTDIYHLISKPLLSCSSIINPPLYRRLVMPLSAILEPDFFNMYIKAGNILLVSQGQLDVDNIFTLSDGVLRLSLDNESYERAGLQGKSAAYGNGPGLMKRRRFLVELNMRSTNFMAGSKMFTKLKRACDQVLNKPTVFLFADIASIPPATDVQTLSKFPARAIRPQITRLETIKIPHFIPPKESVPHGGGKSQEASYNREIWRDWVMEVYEYLSLLLVPGGPCTGRLAAMDTTDPYLSTYVVGEQEDLDPTVGSVTRVKLSGLLSPAWIETLWKEVKSLIGSLGNENAWISMTVHGIENVPVGWSNKERGGLGRCGDGYTVLQLPSQGGELVYQLVGGQESCS